MKVVINTCYGGFGLSDKAIHRFAELSGLTLYKKKDDYFSSYYTDPEFSDDSYFSDSNIERNSPILIQVIEALKEEANGNHANLKVVEIPDDVDWYIEEYDGLEHVAEAHRTWS